MSDRTPPEADPTLLDPADLLEGAAGTAGAPLFGPAAGQAPAADQKVGLAAMTAGPGMRRQLEIYTAGLLGQKPPRPLAVEELEQKAKAVLPPEAYAYVAGSAGSE